jgi:hypothetical protein
MVKKTLPFFDTRPRLRISSGLMRTRASSEKAANAESSLKTCLARILRSARNRIRGLRVGSRLKFQRLWNSF